MTVVRKMENYELQMTVNNLYFWTDSYLKRNTYFYKTNFKKFFQMSHLEKNFFKWRLL